MELITQILAICGAISVIGGAVAVLSGWYKSWKAPKEKQDNRIEQIEKRITNIETSITGINQKLDNDYKNIRNTRDDMNLLMRSMFNLIENKITGNNIEGLKKTREELVNAMTDKKPTFPIEMNREKAEKIMRDELAKWKARQEDLL